ncbi:MAG: hypothetical protein R3E68_04850 [Burkholderiaceae bacterium]
MPVFLHSDGARIPGGRRIVPKANTNDLFRWPAGQCAELVPNTLLATA